jgi:hypothetical protein
MWGVQQTIGCTHHEKSPLEVTGIPSVCIAKSDTRENRPYYSAFAAFVEVEMFTYVTKRGKVMFRTQVFSDMTLCNSPRFEES